MGKSNSKEKVQVPANKLVPCFDFVEQEKTSVGFISLESVCIDERNVTGIVSVKNFDQNEENWEVKVRFTLNSWNSYNDKACECVEEEPDSKMDDGKRFKFEINVPVGMTLECALCCGNAMDGTEFWDNNSEKNYKFTDMVSSVS